MSYLPLVLKNKSSRAVRKYNLDGPKQQCCLQPAIFMCDSPKCVTLELTNSYHFVLKINQHFQQKAQNL